MPESLQKQIVHYDGLIESIVENYPERSIDLLMREFRLANDRESFVAALIGKYALAVSTAGVT